MDTPLIEFRDVRKSFDGNTVLDGINLTIYNNQITTISGKSGGGKSVLLKHFIGLLKPDSGTILFQGRPITGMKSKEWDQYRSMVSYMFQGNALFDSMTVFENIALPLVQTTNISRKEIKRRVLARIEEMELSEVWDKYPSELSGGMQKRAALARALVTDPKIVLFDEPTTGQDPIRKNIILSMIAHYRKKFGFTAILISHDVPDVYFVSDRILMLWEGKIAFQGTYEEMVRLKHPVIDEFLRSLEGFQDELTGLMSKEMFRSRYRAELTAGKEVAMISAVLFAVEFEFLQEGFWSVAGLQILKALAEYTNSHFGPLGGFSARYSRGEILTILPHTGSEEARQLVDGFGRGLQERVLAKIRETTLQQIGMACFEIVIHAGIAEGKATDEIEGMIEKARMQKFKVASVMCGGGGETQ
jgi:phospholipid/cholesterol/gamma-HCH transport system ATP-binding protein